MKNFIGSMMKQSMITKKRKGNPYFLFRDGVSDEKIQGRVSRIHKTVTTHYKYRHIHNLYSRPSTNSLALTMHNKMSNFMFNDTSAPLSDGVAKFIIKGRNGTVWIPARKRTLFKEGDGMCQRCQRIGNLKHYINCCTNKLTSCTYRHNNIGKIIAQAINNHNPQDIIKSENDNLLNWNQELKLRKDIRTTEKDINVEAVPEEEESKRRLDIWFYRIEEDKVNGIIEKKLVCNLVEVTIP
jgi:hypothetical protein